MESSKKLQILLQFWMFSFFSALLVFVFFGKALLLTLNSFSYRFWPNLPLIFTEVNPFWMMLVVSLMLTLIAICFYAQKDLRKYHILLMPFLVSKFVSSFGFFIGFAFLERAFAYFVGFLVDGSIFLITYFFYKSYIKHLYEKENSTSRH